MGRELEAAGNYLFVEGVGVGVAEWQVTTYHGKEDDTAAPQVRHDRVVGTFSLDDLGGSVAGRAAVGLELFVLEIGGAEAKVDDFELVVVVDENVFGL